MKRVVIRRSVQDAAVPIRGRFVRDEILEANSTGKVLAAGVLWDGYLKPKIDMLVDQLSPLKGFTVGHVVTAESEPVVHGMLGRAWRGLIDARTDLLRTNELSRDTGEERVDLSEVYGAVEQLRDQMGTEEVSMSGVQDAVTRLKRARDAVRGKGAARSTSDVSWGTRYLAAARAQNAAAHAKMLTGSEATAAPTRDTAGVLRDAVHRAIQAKDTPTLVRARKDINSAFWAERSYTPAATNYGHILPVRHPDQHNRAPLTIAELNQRNAQYWAAQK